MYSCNHTLDKFISRYCQRVIFSPFDPFSLNDRLSIYFYLTILWFLSSLFIPFRTTT
ncbi:hypothetical protein Hanom_Chr11g01034151 [Helianthus anomalus]